MNHHKTGKLENYKKEKLILTCNVYEHEHEHENENEHEHEHECIYKNDFSWSTFEQC